MALLNDLKVKHQSYKMEKTESGAKWTVSFWGTKSELLAIVGQLQAGQTRTFPDGVTAELDSLAIEQEAADAWKLTASYSSPAAGSVQKPESQLGVKPCTLPAGRLSMPIECCETYLPNWNRFLLASESGGSIPAWWESATDTIIPYAADQLKYKWSKGGEPPRGWFVLKAPQKPGVQTFDVATYQITETLRAASLADGYAQVANKLNKIGAPTYAGGISGGNWKCDSASVAWSGTAWLVRLTWTRSGDENGWDEDIYDSAD